MLICRSLCVTCSATHITHCPSPQKSYTTLTTVSYEKKKKEEEVRGRGVLGAKLPNRRGNGAAYRHSPVYAFSHLRGMGAFVVLPGASGCVYHRKSFTSVHSKDSPLRYIRTETESSHCAATQSVCPHYCGHILH